MVPAPQTSPLRIDVVGDRIDTCFEDPTEDPAWGFMAADDEDSGVSTSQAQAVVQAGTSIEEHAYCSGSDSVLDWASDYLLCDDVSLPMR